VVAALLSGAGAFVLGITRRALPAAESSPSVADARSVVENGRKGRIFGATP